MKWCRTLRQLLPNVISNFRREVAQTVSQVDSVTHLGE